MKSSTCLPAWIARLQLPIPEHVRERQTRAASDEAAGAAAAGAEIRLHETIEPQAGAVRLFRERGSWRRHQHGRRRVRRDGVDVRDGGRRRGVEVGDVDLVAAVTVHGVGHAIGARRDGERGAEARHAAHAGCD